MSGICSAGVAMTLIALPWFVLHTTGSGTRTGLVAAAELVGLLCSSVSAGPLLDRLPPRAVSVGADALTAGALGLVPLLHAMGGLDLPLLGLLAFVIGAARGPADTGKQLLLPAAMARAATSTERATGAVEAARRIGMMAGAPLAGVSVAAVGPVPTLLLDAAAVSLGAVLVAALVPAVPRAAAGAGRDGAEREPYLRELVTGLRWLRGDRLVRAVTGVLLVTNALDGALNGVLYPAYGARVLDSGPLLGAMVTVMGAGALAGAALYGWAGPRLPARLLFTGAFVLLGAVRCATLAAEPPPVVLLALLAVSGVGSGVVAPLMMSVAYRRVPEELRGRVFGLLTACALAATPLGMVGGGLALDHWGLTGTLVATGAVYLVVTSAPLVFPVWRGLGADSPATDASARPVGESATVVDGSSSLPAADPTPPGGADQGRSVPVRAV
ncbi:MFS transporter [Streptomyces sp. NPDC097619]|uniref:MFS transporter n=1 Tax=Streptomyces sp. NPDC097619 TaxID=3157228 RepID=UPI00332411FD